MRGCEFVNWNLNLADIVAYLMFMDLCIVIQISYKEPTRCNRVVELIISMFLSCPTCFG